jgi:hypothetical protein
LLLFSKAKKELPLVAFFCQEKMQQSCKRLSTTIGAISVVCLSVVSRSFQSQSQTPILVFKSFVPFFLRGKKVPIFFLVNYCEAI